jgi:hypothetical protein
VDGGQVALIGFLYQIIGALALRAWAECADSIPGNDFEALLLLIHEGEVRHEVGDIDVLLSQLGLNQPNAHVLVQFKYSQRPEQYPLTPGDVAAICRSFLRSIQQWTNQQRIISRFCIMTNRPISSTLRPVIATLKGQRTHEALDTPELHNMLQRVDILPEIDFSTWISALHSFACKYGVEPTEFEDGVERLIGKLVSRAFMHQSNTIQVEDLAKAFRSYEQPRQLTATAIRSHTKNYWEHLKDRLGVRNMPVRRELLAEVEDNMKRHALIVFSGRGGSGKSVLAWDCLHMMFQETREAAGPVTAFVPARDTQPNTVSWIIGEWAGLPTGLRSEPIERAIHRLRIANPYAQLVFCLALDGLDEQGETRERDTRIYEVLNYFWQRERSLQRQLQAGLLDPPEEILIVTCREYETVTMDWLQGAFSQELRLHPLGHVPVVDFTDNELVRAVEQDMAWALGRFQHTIELQSSLESVMNTSVLGGTFAPISQEVLEAVRHPAMWYAFQQLTTEEQLRLLDGDTQAFPLLAEQFLHWFYVKIRRRWPDWNQDDVPEALEAVAYRASKVESTQFQYALWNEVGRRSEGLERNQMKRLSKEAESAGLIRKDERQGIWEWRHPFVGRYLAWKAQEGGSDE